MFIFYMGLIVICDSDFCQNLVSKKINSKERGILFDISINIVVQVFQLWRKYYAVYDSTPAE